MSQNPIGIIVNPKSGKDVRRIVSHASTITNFEKVNILKRILLGIIATGARWVVYMPDSKDLVGNAFRLIDNKDGLNVSPLNIPIAGNEKDTISATEQMVKIGVGVIITLGGDGTNRLVAKTTNNVPIVPISTGTNNIFPKFIEGTKAGLAAGISLNIIENEKDKNMLCLQAKMIQVEYNGSYDNALIDFAISSSIHLGSRALWNPENLRHLFVTQATTGAIGLTGIVGSVMPISEYDSFGAYAKLGNKKFVKAILASGSVNKVGIDSVEKIDIGIQKKLYLKQGSLWADGEKLTIINESEITVSVIKEGPRILNIKSLFKLAVRNGLLCSI